jgi:hypothetical protein
MRISVRSIILSVALIVLWNQCNAAPSDAIVAIRVGFQFPDGQKTFPSKASGFLISKEGLVVTAKHALEIKVPNNAKLVIEGASPSKDSNYYPLYVYNPIPTNVDITTLKFAPTLRNDWPFLNLSFVDSREGQDVFAWGFPLDQERVGNPGKITGVQGVDPILLPMSANVTEGMSGGPVVDASTGAVIGVITGGGKRVVNGVEQDVPLYYMTPVKYVSDGLKVLGVRSEAEPGIPQLGPPATTSTTLREALRGWWKATVTQRFTANWIGTTYHWIEFELADNDVGLSPRVHNIVFKNGRATYQADQTIDSVLEFNKRGLIIISIEGKEVTLTGGNFIWNPYVPDHYSLTFDGETLSGFTTDNGKNRNVPLHFTRGSPPIITKWSPPWP